MAACGYGPGPDGVYDTPPLAIHGDQAWRTAATYAAIAVLAALAWRRCARPASTGQFIDVSAHECSASMTEWHLMTYLCSGAVYRRGAAPHPHRRRRPQVAALNPDFLGPARVRPCMLEMLEAAGVAGPLSDPAFADPVTAPRTTARCGGRSNAGRNHDGEDLYRLGQARGLPWGVIRSPRRGRSTTGTCRPGATSPPSNIRSFRSM